MSQSRRQPIFTEPSVSAPQWAMGIPEMLTLTRLGLPDYLRRSLASTSIKSVNSVIARASRSVAHWQSASMGLK